MRRGRTPCGTPAFSLSGAGAAPRLPSRPPGARRPGTAVSSRAHVLRSQSARAKAGDDARWGHLEAPSPTRLLVADRGRAVMGTPTTGFLAARRLLRGQRPADPDTWPPGPWAQAAWTQGGGQRPHPPQGGVEVAVAVWGTRGLPAASHTCSRQARHAHVCAPWPLVSTNDSVKRLLHGARAVCPTGCLQPTVCAAPGAAAAHQNHLRPLLRAGRAHSDRGESPCPLSMAAEPGTCQALQKSGRNNPGQGQPLRGAVADAHPEGPAANMCPAASRRETARPAAPGSPLGPAWGRPAMSMRRPLLREGAGLPRAPLSLGVP